MADLNIGPLRVEYRLRLTRALSIYPSHPAGFELALVARAGGKDLYMATVVEPHFLQQFTNQHVEELFRGIAFELAEAFTQRLKDAYTEAAERGQLP